MVVDDTADDLSTALNPWRDRLQLRVVRSSTRGSPGANRNFGVAESQADLLLFVDADDTVCSKYIKAMVDALESHPFVCSRVELSSLNPESRSSHPQSRGLITAELGFLPFAGSGTLGIRRSLFTEMGGFASSLPCYEEADLCWRIQLSGHDPPYWVRDAVLNYRSPRATVFGTHSRWRRAFAFGRVQPLLYRRFRGMGMPRSTGRALAELVQLCWRLGRGFVTGNPARGMRQLAAVKMGRIFGSIKYRVLYL